MLNKGEFLAEIRSKEGWTLVAVGPRRWFCTSDVDRVLTHMAATSLRWLQTLLKTGCLPSPSISEPFHTMPGQLLSSGSGHQRYCPPPALPSWICGKLKFEDGRRANLCHSTWDSSKSWNTVRYCFSLAKKESQKSSFFSMQLRNVYYS